MKIKVPGERTHSAQKYYIHHIITNNQGRKLSTVSFRAKPCQTVLKQDYAIWNFNTTGLLYIFVEDRRKTSSLKKKVKALKRRKDWTKFSTKIGFLWPSWGNIWSRIRKSSTIWQEKETMISTFAYFLTAITKT